MLTIEFESVVNFHFQYKYILQYFLMTKGGWLVVGWWLYLDVSQKSHPPTSISSSWISFTSVLEFDWRTI